MYEKIMLWPKPVPGDFQPYLEIFTLDGATAKEGGMIVICPGGGYHFRSEREGANIAECFNRLGWHAAVLQYRVAPAVFPAPQQDALRALKIIRASAARLGVKTDNLAIAGFSAGGHVAASCGTIWPAVDANAGDAIDGENARPDALLLFYPVICLSSEFGHVGSGCNLLGMENPDPEMLKSLQLDLRVSRSTPPAFLWHTATDQSVPVRNSLAFSEAMWAQGLTAELHIFPRGKHGLALGLDEGAPPEIRVWPELADHFLRTLNFVPAV